MMTVLNWLITKGIVIMRVKNIVIMITTILYTFLWITVTIFSIINYNQMLNIDGEPLGTYMVRASYAGIVLITFTGLLSAILLMLSVFTYYSHNKPTSIYKKRPLVFSSIANMLIFPVLFLLFQNNNAFVICSLVLFIILLINIIICTILLLLYVIKE